jgi:hypothetical protein
MLRWRREIRRERGEAGCNLTADLDREPRNFLRHTSGHVSIEDYNYYMGGLRGRLQ